jgi:hypothetical protein
MSETETRNPMWCDVCRQGDTDPRHHVLMADGSVQTRHMDCCRDNGCHDSSCGKILEMSGDKRKTELLQFLHENGAAVHAEVSTKEGE